jgi:Zn-dependent peptidase ImmA (M78 family)
MSYILTSIAEKKIDYWNEKVFTERDFFELCRRESIRVIEGDFVARGEYKVYKKWPFILLRRRLPAAMRIWIQWHELAHHFLHYPGSYLFDPSAARKVDFEANFVASIALIPTKLMEDRGLEEIATEFNYPKKLIEIRRRIAEHYRI